MQENNNITKGQVPLLGDIPIIGNAFKQKNNNIKRTELLIIIRPRVVRDTDEARQVTNEFRKELNLNIRPNRSGPPTFKENVKRVFE